MEYLQLLKNIHIYSILYVSGCTKMYGVNSFPDNKVLELSTLLVDGKRYSKGKKCRLLACSPFAMMFSKASFVRVVVNWINRYCNRLMFVTFEHQNQGKEKRKSNNNYCKIKKKNSCNLILVCQVQLNAPL